MPYSTEDDVFEVIPAEIKRPSEVLIDGKGGVTQKTYTSYQLRYTRSIDAELLKAGLVPPSQEPYDELLVGAEAHMIAGAIMRRFNSLQQQYLDAYATANIFLRQYISIRQLEQGVHIGAPTFVTDTSVEVKLAGSGFPDL